MKSKEEKSRNLKNGSYSALLTVAVAAVLIVANLIVSSLPSTFTKFDISEQQRLNFSGQTKKLLDNLEQDVTIYFLTQQGSEDNSVKELVEKYEGMSPKIEMVTKDTALNPDFVNDYTSEAVEDNSLIVECGERSKVITYSEIYQQTRGTNSNGESVVATDFDGENQVTSAIDFVTSENLPVVYTLSGHRESTLPDEMVSQINKDNLDVQTLSLLSAGKVPEDCDSLIIYGPQKDITSDEAQMLKTYLEAGGKLIYVADYLAASLTNLEGVLAEYGIGFDSGVAIESDQNHYYQYPYITIPEMNSHTITDPLINNQLPVVAPLARCIKVTDAEGVTVTTLLVTTSKAYAVDPEVTSSDELKKAKTSARRLGVLFEKTVDAEHQTQIVVYGSQSMFTKEINEQMAVGNYDLLSNTLGYLSGHESAIAIHSKSMDGTLLSVTEAEANIWSLVTVAVIPAAFLATGIVIWIKRRRR